MDKENEEILASPANETVDANNNSKNSNSFEDTLANIANKKVVLPNASKNPIDTILDEYCEAPVIPITEDPLMFWKDWSESGNPLKIKFSDVAVESLTPPSGSVGVERLFSTAGDVASPEANKLKPENLEKKLFCRNNLPKINFEY